MIHFPNLLSKFWLSETRNPVGSHREGHWSLILIFVIWIFYHLMLYILFYTIKSCLFYIKCPLYVIGFLLYLGCSSYLIFFSNLLLNWSIQLFLGTPKSFGYMKFVFIHYQFCQHSFNNLSFVINFKCCIYHTPCFYIYKDCLRVFLQ